MENKLQQLTEKLYNKGLEKGKNEAQLILNEANAKRDEIINQAKLEAEKILTDAKRKANELNENTINEIKLTATQLISQIRTQILETVTTKVVSSKVQKAWMDAEFVKKLILEAVAKFNPSANQPVTVLVSAEFADNVKKEITEAFNQTVTITTADKVKVPFVIKPEKENYYVSFTDKDFDELIKNALRSTVKEIIF